MDAPHGDRRIRLVRAASVNAASRLAMLAERMAKLNAQVGRGVLVTRSQRALREASTQFDRGLAEINALALPAELREDYRLLRVLWDEYRPLALQVPTAEAGRKLAERAEEVSWIATKGARMMHGEGHTRAGELVMAAGGARAAAERLGKLHLQRGWALPANGAAREVKLAEGEIFLALAQLKSVPETDEDAAAALRMAESQMAFLRQAVERLGGGKDRATQLDHIAKSSDHIAETLDRIAERYETAPG